MTFSEIAKKHSSNLSELNLLKKNFPESYDYCFKEAKLFTVTEFAISLEKFSEIVISRKRDFDYHGLELEIVEKFFKRLSFNITSKAYLA